MNENLVRRLRRLESEHKKEWGGATEESCLIAEAADVIETLSAQRAGYAKVVRCAECNYAPKGTEGFDLEWPYANDEGYDVNPCPLKCADPWYSHKPKPDFFCGYGEKKEDEE